MEMKMPIPGEFLNSGWGVMRLSPWHLAGVFVTSPEAEQYALTLGVPYVVRYGDHEKNTSAFSFVAAPD